MIHLLIRRAAMLTLALLITYGLFHDANAEIRTQEVLQDTASVLEQQEPKDVRITVRDPDPGDVPTVDPEAIRRALERAGIDAIVVAESDSRSEGTREDRPPPPSGNGPDTRQDGDGEGDQDGEGNGRQGPDESRPDGDATPPDEPTDDRPLLAVCAAADTDPLLVASLCAAVDVDEEPNR